MEVEAQLERLWVERQAGPVEILVDDIDAFTAACFGLTKQQFLCYPNRVSKLVLRDPGIPWPEKPEVQFYRSKWTGYLSVTVVDGASVDKSESIMCEWAACHGRGR